MSTISAIATPCGNGGIGIVRVSGPGVSGLLNAIFVPAGRSHPLSLPWRLCRGTVLDDQDSPLDDALAVFMPGPATFTGEDVCEIHCHGGSFLVRSVLASTLARGARPAGRGEFSRRAYLNGRMDLSQAEAVAEMIAAPGREALRYGLARLRGALGRRVREIAEDLASLRALVCVAVDFPDDEVQPIDRQEFACKVHALAENAGRLLGSSRRAALAHRGARVVIAGEVNAGKSSMLNALLGRDRALVSSRPGTTRDFIEEIIDVDGLPLRLVDTAGLRREAQAVDDLESLGISLSRSMLSDADAILLVLDGSRHDPQDGSPDLVTAEVLTMAGAVPLLLVWNKCDLARPAVFPPRWGENYPGIVVSAKSGENLDQLAETLRSMLLDGADGPYCDEEVAPNERQAAYLRSSLAELEELEKDIQAGQSYDCCMARLDTAAAHLADITGLASHAELLDRIFSTFCIGK